MRRRGPTGEISFSFGERKHILSMVIIDVAANVGESKRKSLGFPPRGKWHAGKGPCGSVWWLCVPSSGSCSLWIVRVVTLIPCLTLGPVWVTGWLYGDGAGHVRAPPP